MSIEQRAERFAECQRLLSTLYCMTPEQEAEFERLKAREMDRAERARQAAAQYRDCLQFALDHGIAGSPKYKREAIRCLHVALDLLSTSA